MDNIKNHIVFITGASSGIGRACAVEFAKAGAKLVLAARRKDRLEELAKDLSKKFNTESLLLQLDVRNEKDVTKSIETLPVKWVEIDVLINNAGLSRGLEKIQDGVISNWEEMIDTNIKGLLYITRVVLPIMIKKNKGHIINIGSIAGHEIYPGGNVYNATKHAVKALNKGMRMDVFGTNIRVTSIDPGSVETEFSMVRFKGDADKAKQVYKGMCPLNPEDIADAVLWSCSRPAHVNIEDMIIMPTDQASVNMVNRK